tara:strand:- start:186 stop:683 length:498 start_codon:yes stop_codon:yes gene_type:complete
MKAYQLSLSEQLKNAAETASTATMLGVVVGENRCLVHMGEVNEVIQVPKLAPVALTQSWFLGMANVRGNLYSIADLAVYWRGVPTPFGTKARVLLVAPRFKINSGLLVSNMLGIRSLSDFERIEGAQTAIQTGIAGHYKDKEGRPWLELNLQELIRDEMFLQIAV